MKKSKRELDLFLLPHQDDEFGAFCALESSLASGRQPLIIYVTNGAYGRATTEQRDAESLNVLRRLGIREEWIWFLGSKERIPDQGLAHNLELIHDSLIAALQTLDERQHVVSSIYAPSWEGGHPDHDAAALLAIALGKTLSLPESIFQFPLYNSYRKKLLPYAVFNPIFEAGYVQETYIPIKRRLEYVMLCLQYRSQKKTFIGLLPFVISHYLRRGTQQIQRIDATTIANRPHNSLLLYERRGWMSWSQFEAAIAAFRWAHDLPLSGAESP